MEACNPCALGKKAPTGANIFVAAVITFIFFFVIFFVVLWAYTGYRNKQISNTTPINYGSIAGFSAVAAIIATILVLLLGIMM